jgi:GLPGLI family protein
MLSSKSSILSILLIILTQVCLAQEPGKKVIKVTYTSIPVSQYNIDKKDMLSTPTTASILEVLQGTKSYYSLYVNLADRSSVYALDSIITVKPRGRAKTKASIAEKVHFLIKSPENKTYKYEWVMDQLFFTEGKPGDIVWELTNETRKINGLKCFKAVSKNKYLMLTAWYTKDIPVSNGPSIYLGLPGLVVWAEDFFRTTEIQSIEYTDDVNQFNTLYSERMNFFNEKEHHKNYDKEPILVLKKADMANHLYKMIHGKSYTD